jgi:hypothetical protein
MRWLSLAAPAALVCIVTGCLAAAAVNPEDALTVARAQQPDPPKPKPPARTLLDTSPEQVGDPQVVRVAASIRAMVNGAPILNEELREACFGKLLEVRLMGLPADEQLAREKEVLVTTLEQLIERELLLQDAQVRLKGPQGQKYMEKMREAFGRDFDKWLRTRKTMLGMKSDDDVKNWFNRQGLSLQGIRRQLERQFMAEEYLRQLALGPVDRIGHEQIVEYYQQHPEEFQVQDSVKWQDLFLDAGLYPSRDAAHQAADQIADQIRKGAEFVKLAEQYDKGFRFTNGDGYGQKRGQIRPPEAEPFLFSMRAGDVNVVAFPNGFHVIRLVKRDVAGRMPFDDKLQGQIKEKLRNEVYAREQKRILSQLKQRAVIESSSVVP